MGSSTSKRIPVSLVAGESGSSEITGSIMTVVPRELMRNPALVSHQRAVPDDLPKALGFRRLVGEALI
jgi:hypothetical protein